SYIVENNIEPSPAPQWLLDRCASRFKVTEGKAKQPRTPATEPQAVSSAGGMSEVQDGNRNSALTSEAGRLRHFGADQEQIETTLLSKNALLSEPLEIDEVLQIAKSISGYEPTVDMLGDGAFSPHTRPLTDLGNSERFADLKIGQLRYVFGLDQWIRWNGICWESAGTILEDLKLVSRSIVSEALANADEGRRASLLKHAINSESQAKLAAMRSLAEQTAVLQVMAEALDRMSHLLGTPSGVVDLRKGALVESTPDQWITMQTAVGFDPEATCPRWEQFISEIMGGDQLMMDFLKVLFGSMLIGGNKEQILVILHGIGSNGKSVLIEVIKWIMGVYSKTSGADTFIESGGGGPREDIVRLRGCRSLFVSE
ncbi:MAG: hypothetical protein HN344_10720, partial [Gammaproteobacteria bacterium]|nr:hypothetical protein [Gammaproteobacteria bacterium]